MKVFLGADHRGFELKEKIKAFLEDLNFEIIDKGAFEYNKDDDFVDFAREVADEVIYYSKSRGILFCGSGAGGEIAANKIKGIRAFVGFNEEQTKNAMNDDNPNILGISSDFTDFQKTKGIVKAFLETEFDPSPKHLRRVNKIEALEA
jgi:ribose 5-phosphate isomerase B